jgi:hypothetical protein
LLYHGPMTRPLSIALLALAAVVLAATAGTAEAEHKHHRYVGIHPVPKGHGGGLCHIQAPHVHVYPALDARVQFRDHDGWNHFVGDPVAYGWDGPKHAYYGHHPIPVHAVVGDDHEDMEYCYLDGAHYHAWAPPAGLDLDLEVRGGAYWYVGTFPRAYVEARPVYDPIDVVYKPIQYPRPVVEVSVAPPAWYGAVVVEPAVVVPARVEHRGRPAHARAGVEVHVPAPALRVEVAVPTVHIGIGGGVIVHDGHHGHGHKVKHRKHKHRRGRGHGRGHDD